MPKNDLVENIDIISSGPKVQKFFSIQFNPSPETLLCHSQLLALALWNHWKNGI